MEPPVSIENVCKAVQTLYSNPNTEAKEAASAWLGDLQRSVHAWQIADQLLRLHHSVEASYFAAQTMRSKIQYAFHELPIESHQSLKDSLLDHIENTTELTQVIVTQLCLALADLALQMTQWKNSCLDLIQRFGNSSSHISFLLEVLMVMPEEVHNKTLRLGKNRKEELKNEMDKSVNMVFTLLETCIQTYTDEKMLGKVFRCLSSWLNYKIIPSQDIANSILFTTPFQVLANIGVSSSLHESASDCVCSALYLCDDMDANKTLAQSLFLLVIQLPEAYHTAVAEEDIDKSINFCRIFTEMAESFLHPLLETPGQGLGDLRIMELVLLSVDHCQYEVAAITFNFWFRLSEILYQKYNNDLNNIFRPFFEKLVISLHTHSRLDPDHVGLPDEQDDFADFRLKVSELIKDIIFIVGSSTCFKQMFCGLTDQGPSMSWDIIESSLFIMASIAKNVLPDEEEVVPKVVQAILSLPPIIHIAIKYTSIQLLGELCEWIDHHPSFLEPILNFLTSNLHLPALASVSAISLMNLCSICCDQMGQNHIDGLLHLVGAINSLEISNDAAISLLKGISVTLSKMPIEKLNEAIKKLFLIQVNPLKELLHKNEKKNGGKNNPVLWLDRISAIFRHITPKVSNDQIHPCQPILLEIWPILSEIFDTYQSSVLVTERCCRCLRFAVRCIGKGATVLLPSLVSQMVIVYQSHQHSCFLYLGSILVDEYGTDVLYNPGLLQMLEAFWSPTYQLLQESNGLRNHPDTVDDLFRLCSRFLQKCPIILLQSSIITQIIQCSIKAITLDHRDANTSVMKFLRVFLSCGIHKKDEIDYDTRKQLVQTLLVTNGQAMISTLISANLFHLPLYMSEDLAEVLYDIIKFNRLAVSQWLENSLKSLPADTRTGKVSATHNQLTDFHNVVTSAENEQIITKALKEFSRLFR